MHVAVCGTCDITGNVCTYARLWNPSIAQTNTRLDVALAFPPQAISPIDSHLSESRLRTSRQRAQNDHNAPSLSLI